MSCRKNFDTQMSKSGSDTIIDATIVRMLIIVVMFFWSKN